MTDSNDRDQTEQRVEDFRTKIGRLREEVGKVIVGHRVAVSYTHLTLPTIYSV